MGVEVPAAFREIGYSGLFHTLATFPDEATRAKARADAPYLVDNTGWMVLEVNPDGNAVMVRRDSAAICDLVFVPKRETSKPDVPSRMRGQNVSRAWPDESGSLAHDPKGSSE